MMHWNASLAESEKTEILEWIKSVRKEKYASAHVAEEFAGEPVQPLPVPVIQNPKKVELGNKLFHDKRLSADDTIACATCHALDKGGTDQAQFSTGIDGQVGGINSPTVYNAVYNHLQFWDGRAKDLREQADGPVNNPIEMGANWDMVIPKIKKDPYYQQAFAELYSDGMTGPNACDAIAAFEETLITPNSRFDKYLTGDKSALSSEEIEGYHLFVETGCTSCHLGAALGGTHFEKMGRMKDYFAQRGNVGEADQGRFNVSKDEKERHTFKVPTLRNIELTHPYFHDGQTKTLAEAINIMATYQLGKSLPSQQIDKLEKFLLTLTGEYNGHPLGKEMSGI
jgi:cytochrome c peroxidase